ncbi:MAG: helix-turn-helix transcriptional regulator [Chloroflexi bacterium]|nr:helix-turn-helix transcriptional regulator [Chloroflexota bacterium]
MTTDELRVVTRVRHLARTGIARVLREEAGVGLVELAGAIGSAPSTLSRWERGLTSPRPKGAIAWSRALDAAGADRGEQR